MPPTKNRLTGISPGNLVLNDGPGKDRFRVNRDYLLSLEPAAYLEAFYKACPITEVPEPKPTVSWTGWVGAKHNWAGHDGEFHGHYLSALARIVGLTGDAEVRARADALVDALARFQRPNGSIYIGYVNENNIDNLFRGIEPRVIVFYTIHKLLMGWFELYRYAGSDRALDMCRRWADDLAGRIRPLDDTAVEQLLTVEHGGIAEILLDIAAVTQKQEHLDTGLRLLQKSVIDPLAHGEDRLTNVHANTTIPILQGAARAYELTGNEHYRRAVEFFWDLIDRTRNFATGSSSSKEFWQAPNQLKETLNPSTQETCVSFNWLRLTEYLLRWTGETRYGDAYERCHINGILAAQHPRTGQFVYFMPMKPGPRDPNPDGYDPDPPEQGGKHFGRSLRCFWCCYGTGSQAFANPLEGAYYQNDDGVWVNQFIASKVSFKHAVLRQETGFPFEDRTRIVVEQAGGDPFSLNIRVPGWRKENARILLNGNPIGENASYFAWFTLHRIWKSGDVLDVDLPMSLSTKTINNDPNCRAVVFGPHVLAGCVGDAAAFQMPDGEPAEWLESERNNPLVFVPKPESPIRFIPLCNVTNEEYHVYFDVTGKNQ